MAGLYSNENFPMPAVHELRRLGHDVLTIMETGRANRRVPDEEVLAFSLREGRVLLTLNRKHFVRLHAAGTPHTGIIACTVDADFIRQAARIDERVRSVGNSNSLLVRVNRPPAQS